VKAAVLTVLIATTAFGASPFHFGEPVPLTNTRYTGESSNAKLISNGRDLFVLWEAPSVVRITRARDPESLTGHAIASGSLPVAVWTGSRFVIATSAGVRALDAEGVPIGPQVNLPDMAFAKGIATNGRNVMVLARVAQELRAYVLDAAGAIAIGEGQLVESIDEYASAIASNGKGYVAINKSAADLRVTFFDESGALRMQRTLPGNDPHGMAIASDGSGYLAVWTGSDGVLRSITIDEDGTLGTTHSPASTPPNASALTVQSLVWTGNRYAAAFSTQTPTGPRAYTAFFASGSWTEQEPLDGLSSFSPSLALANGQLLALWGTADHVKLRDLAGSEVREVRALAATGQFVFRAISSQDATLITWAESEWHMGIRRRDGTWSERTFGDDELTTPYTTSRRLGTDGHGFVVASIGGWSSVANYYDANGTPRWTGVRIPFLVDDIVWAGNDFVLTGMDSTRKLVGTKLSASGVVFPPIVIASSEDLGSSRLATDGTSILITWTSTAECAQFCPPFQQTFGMLRDRDFHPISQPVEILQTQWSYGEYFLSWDGTGYTVTYLCRASDAAGVFVKRISRQGVPDASTLQITDESDTRFTAAPTKWGTAIVWPTVRDGVWVEEARLVAPDGSVSSIGTFARDWSNGQQLISLPDGRLGLISTRSPIAEPYFGSSRAVLAVGDVVAPARVPDAPKVTVALDADQRLRVQWTAPVQPVNGYRVEYKIGKQDWLELEAWFRPAETTLALTPAGDAAKYSFRVRAWSDSGTSAYSAPASLPVKRRSVR
jgi:fibronectin type III domain protein